MYVCICRAVTDRDIENAVAAGARRLRDLRVELGVTEECGRCARCAKACLHNALDQHPARPPSHHLPAPGAHPSPSRSPFLLIQEAA